MPVLRGLFDRVVLIGGVVAGGMVPSYLAQYRQRVGGALGQALHGGSLARLIQHHLASTDATFHQEGAAIQAMVDSVASLRHALAALDANVFQQLLYVITQTDTAMAQATWAAFRPSFGLTADSLLMAAAFGVSIWLLFLAVWWLAARVFTRGRAVPFRPGSSARR